MRNKDGKSASSRVHSWKGTWGANVPVTKDGSVGLSQAREIIRGPPGKPEGSSSRHAVACEPPTFPRSGLGKCLWLGRGGDAPLQNGSVCVPPVRDGVQRVPIAQLLWVPVALQQGNYLPYTSVSLSEKWVLSLPHRDLKINFGYDYFKNVSWCLGYIKGKRNGCN